MPRLLTLKTGGDIFKQCSSIIINWTAPTSTPEGSDPSIFDFKIKTIWVKSSESKSNGLSLPGNVITGKHAHKAAGQLPAAAPTSSQRPQSGEPCAQGWVWWLTQFFTVVFKHSSILHRTAAYKERMICPLITCIAEALQIWTKTQLCVWGG